MWHFSLVLYKKFHWIKYERLSASIIPNTQSFLDGYTNEICQRQKVCLKKSPLKQNVYMLQLSWTITDGAKI